MIIGINTLSILPGKNGGGETYLVNLVESLIKLDKNNTYILFVNKGNQLLFPDADNVKKVFCPISKKNVLFRIIWEQIALPFLVLKYRLEVLFAPANMMPVLWLPCKSVLTIHDMFWANYGHFLSKKQYLILKYLVSKSAIKADMIIAISNFTKKDIVKFLKVDSRKIVVIYEGFNNLKNISSQSSKNNTVLISGHYILSVGRTHPHKNYPRLIEAFKQVKMGGGYPGGRLVIAGIVGFQHDSLVNKIKTEHLSEDVVLLSNVSANELRLLYQNAEAFVFPSLYEGFGLPLLEAMSFGLPVIAADSSALPEIGGEAAIYFNPLNPKEIAEKIKLLMSSAELRESLGKKGLAHSRTFYWEKTANQTLEAIRTTGENKS